jgi:hypothetical protein
MGDLSRLTSRDIVERLSGRDLDTLARVRMDAGHVVLVLSSGVEIAPTAKQMAKLGWSQMDVIARLARLGRPVMT